jgi:hypothetical protein
MRIIALRGGVHGGGGSAGVVGSSIDSRPRVEREDGVKTMKLRSNQTFHSGGGSTPLATKNTAGHAAGGLSLPNGARGVSFA